MIYFSFLFQKQQFLAKTQPRSLRPTNFVNWPWLSPLTHRERRHTVALHMERRHTETHKNTTQQTHIERNSNKRADLRTIRTGMQT